MNVYITFVHPGVEATRTAFSVEVPQVAPINELTHEWQTDARLLIERLQEQTPELAGGPFSFFLSFLWSVFFFFFFFFSLAFFHVDFVVPRCSSQRVVFAGASEISYPDPVQPEYSRCLRRPAAGSDTIDAGHDACVIYVSANNSLKITVRFSAPLPTPASSQPVQQPTALVDSAQRVPPSSSGLRNKPRHGKGTWRSNKVSTTSIPMLQSWHHGGLPCCSLSATATRCHQCR